MRFGDNFRGPIIPFGAEVEIFPIISKKTSRVHQMADKWLRGIFAGYKQQAGGGWSGNLKVMDWDELKESHNISQVHLRDLPPGQVWPVIKDGKISRSQMVI